MTSENPSAACDTLLIVEDSPLLCSIYEIALEEYAEQGYNLVFAGNGREALDALEELDGMPAFVLLDLNMPVMGGVAFLECFRVIPRFQSVPVIILSNETEEEVQRALDAGADAFLRKSFQPERLRELITGFLGEEGEDDEAWEENASMRALG